MARVSARHQRTALYQSGYENALDTLDQFHGPMLSAIVERLLTVTPDPDDDPDYDAGFRAGLRKALGIGRALN